VRYNGDSQWYGFRPIYVNPEHTQVALEVLTRVEAGRGEAA